jgi:hydrogenase maturation protease
MILLPSPAAGRGVGGEDTSGEARLLLLEGGPSPENVTGALRRFRPDLVLLVDAALMGLPPGAVRWLDWQDIDGVSASTHTLPLRLVAMYLTQELGCQVGLLGIEPLGTTFGEPLTPKVRTAVSRTARTLADLLDTIKPSAAVPEQGSPSA